MHVEEQVFSATAWDTSRAYALEKDWLLIHVKIDRIYHPDFGVDPDDPSAWRKVADDNADPLPRQEVLLPIDRVEQSRLEQSSLLLG